MSNYKYICIYISSLFLLFRPYIAHTDPIFNKYTLIKIHDLYKLQLYKLFCRLCNNLLPLYFNSFFPTVNRTNYNLRNESIKLPMTRRTYSMFDQLNINCICYCVLLYTNTLNLQILPPCMLILAVSRLILSVGIIQIVLFQIAMSV